MVSSADQLRPDQVAGAVIDGVRPEHHHGAFDVVDAAPLVELAGAHPQEVAGVEGVVGEVDGMHLGAALEVEEQVEVEDLGGEELVRAAALTDAREGIHLDVADIRRRGEIAHSADRRLSHFHHHTDRKYRER